jgi:hypothetical protein
MQRIPVWAFNKFKRDKSKGVPLPNSCVMARTGRRTEDAPALYPGDLKRFMALTIDHPDEKILLPGVIGIQVEKPNGRPAI